MDTSKEYILMCEKAVEIQKEWVPKEGDWVYVKDGKHGRVRVLFSEHYEGRSNDELFYEYDNEAYYPSAMSFDKDVSGIWLPRQDQLQGMVEQEALLFSGRFCHLTEFIKWFKEENADYIERFLTMEQLWLAYVMKEKYNETWNGKDWKCLK